MKRRIKLSLIAITCFGVINPATAGADNPLDKFIPRGTFFKKLKKEISEEFGGDKSKTPTPALRPGDRQPTPATARNTAPRDAQSQQLRRQSQSVGQTPRPSDLATRPLPPMLNGTPHAAGHGNRLIAPSKIGAAVGFGVIVQAAKNNDLVVTRVHPQGNGVAAGLRPGDIVKTVGGVELTSVEEYDQITKGLGGGDQMEFEVVRRGRPEKTLVTYGTLAADSTIDVAIDQGSSESAFQNAPSVLDNAMQAGVRVSRLPRSAPSVVAVKTETERRLARTIESQRAKMERMEQELEMLRKTTSPAIAPTENNWAFPDINPPN